MEVRVLSPALLLLALALLAAGCSGGDGGTRTVTTTAGTAAWPGPPLPRSSGRLGVQAFNRYLSTRPDLARSPLRAAIEFGRFDRTAARTTSAVASTGTEGATRADVVLTASGLEDDSVRAVRYVLRFDRTGRSWRLGTARQSQRCWPGRGHQKFSPRPCV